MYTLLLVILSLVMAGVILNSSSILSLNYNFIKIDNKLSKAITDKSQVLFSLAKSLNANGTGFIDAISCPTTVTMSGTTSSGIILTTLYVNSDNIYCSGSYNGDPLRIYMNTGANDFILADYSGSVVSLVDLAPGKVAFTDFTDTDSTFLDFSTYDISIGDNIDDNINSDNYTVTSTGIIAYPDNFQDDDVLHRKNNIGYIKSGSGFQSIFWNNWQTDTFIDNNSNNEDIINHTIGLTASGVLYFNIDRDYSMILYKMNKNTYKETKELELLEKRSGDNLLSGTGFLQDNSGDLSLSGSITGNEYLFDFQTFDYSLFVENTSTGVLSYEMTGFDAVTGSGLYIVPIDDSDNILLEYLGNSIIINDEGRLISKQKKIISSK